MFTGKTIYQCRKLITNTQLFRPFHPPTNKLFQVRFAAVNLTWNKGKLEAGWQPQEKISIDEVYNSYFTIPAYLNHLDKGNTRFLPGFHTDIVLLEQHYEEAGKNLPQ